MGGKGHSNQKRGLIAGVLVCAVMLLVTLLILFRADVLAFIKDLYAVKYRPKLVAGAGLGIVFVYGFFTSFHCIGMCGGIILSQTAVKPHENETAAATKAWIPSLLYNLGRIVMCTVVGGLAGGLGQMISFAGVWKGLVPLISGIVMLLMGLDLLIGLPFLRKIKMKVPRLFHGKLDSGSGGPFLVGMLTALLPCGPLQIAQAYALGTGSVFYGALSMLVFAIGTGPLLFVLGAFSTYVNRKFMRVLLKVSAVLVIILGVLMLSKAYTMSGLDTYKNMPGQDVPVQAESVPDCCQ
jgi:sulfite exporter TauE/SafE